MQVLCTTSQDTSQTATDVQCPVCGAGFQLYWERTSRTERSLALKKIQQALVEHHEAATEGESGPHPTEAFTVPSWGGHPHFSGAALLGGFPGLSRQTA